MQTEPFPSGTEIQEWTRQQTSFHENLPDKLMLVDANSTRWVSLNLYDIIKTKQFEGKSMGLSRGSQQIWLTAHGYFVKPEAFEVLKKQFAPGSFDRDFPQGLDVYQLFNREYSWSPGYQSIFQPSCFEAEIEIGEKKLIKKTIDIPELIFTEEGDFEFKVGKKEIETFVPDDVIHVKVTPDYSHLLWEEEYDASQEDTTSFDVPCREIIEYLHLEQKEHDGYYFNPNGELICFDASLSGICDGLLIRKDYLEQFLTATGMKLFWLCTGEKQFFQGEHSQSWQRWEGFIHYNQSQVEGSLEPVEGN